MRKATLFAVKQNAANFILHFNMSLHFLQGNKWLDTQES
jgi:hypothetical protein